ncbi:MAG: hypothetical protein AUK54_01530 [Helicobacteraceae bacterium CG2_30_36_10]|nr:MAG: hypothetical protein AUK54_01530 [Helicobacteraceae bacterium CG2_30_36_10]
MKLETSTLMMIFFIILLVISIWKIYAFLPNRQLADDDTTKESQEELMRLILNVIKRCEGNLSTNELFKKVTDDESFDAKHYWRFNHNRLNQLLNKYYAQNPHAKSIKDIYLSLH